MRDAVWGREVATLCGESMLCGTRGGDSVRGRCTGTLCGTLCGEAVAGDVVAGDAVAGTLCGTLCGTCEALLLQGHFVAGTLCGDAVRDAVRGRCVFFEDLFFVLSPTNR